MRNSKPSLPWSSSISCQFTSYIQHIFPSLPLFCCQCSCKSPSCLPHPSPDSTPADFCFPNPIPAHSASLYYSQGDLTLLLPLVSEFSAGTFSSLWASWRLLLPSCTWGWTILQLPRGEPSKPASSPGPSATPVILRCCRGWSNEYAWLKMILLQLTLIKGKFNTDMYHVLNKLNSDSNVCQVSLYTFTLTEISDMLPPHLFQQLNLFK